MSALAEILAKQDEILARLDRIEDRLDQMSGDDEWPDEDSPEMMEAKARFAEKLLAEEGADEPFEEVCNRLGLRR